MLILLSCIFLEIYSFHKNLKFKPFIIFRFPLNNCRLVSNIPFSFLIMAAFFFQFTSLFIYFWTHMPFLGLVNSLYCMFACCIINYYSYLSPLLSWVSSAANLLTHWHRCLVYKVFVFLLFLDSSIQAINFPLDTFQIYLTNFAM